MTSTKTCLRKKTLLGSLYKKISASEKVSPAENELLEAPFSETEVKEAILALILMGLEGVLD